MSALTITFAALVHAFSIWFPLVVVVAAVWVGVAWLLRDGGRA